jgi:hypothetical protein
MHKYLFHRRLDGIDFYAPSSRHNKKYDAYVDGKMYSFGDARYQQYRDRIEYYKDFDHLDKKRRFKYIKRHMHDDLDHYSAGYFSYFYLW